MSRSSFAVVSLVWLAFGLFILYNSVGWGSQAANAYLGSQGGGIDTAQFMIVLQDSMITFRWIGGILTVISGLGFVRAMDKMSKI